MPSLNLYTMPGMDDVTVTTVSTEATGHPIEYAFDNNPDTYWSPSTSGGATVDIDLGEASTVDVVGYMFHNHNSFGASLTSGNTMEFYSDDNDDGNYSATTLFATAAAVTYIPANSEQPVVLSGTTGISKRYWRIIHDCNVTTAVEVGQFMFGRTRSITRSSQLPVDETQQFHNHISKAPGGRTFVRGMNSQSVLIRRRKYAVESTDMQAAWDAHADSRGTLVPMVMIDGNSEGTAFCRFGSDKLKRRMLTADYYDMTFDINDIPYTPDGESF